MRCYRTISIDTEVNLDVYEVLDELNDDELIEEIKKRKCDMRFMDFSFPELDDNTFRDRMVEMIYQVTTDRAAIILEALRDSYHYPFIKEDTPCAQ